VFIASDFDFVIGSSQILIRDISSIHNMNVHKLEICPICNLMDGTLEDLCYSRHWYN